MPIEGLDELDNRILDIIKDNARMTYKEIGDRVGISRVSVKTRMDSMQEKGIIRGFQTVIDPTHVREYENGLRHSPRTAERISPDRQCPPPKPSRILRALSAR